MEESKLLRTHANQPDPHHNPSGLEGGDENHHEKKSVLGRVRARAKKIKNTFTKQNPDDEYDHDKNEDEDEVEEMVEDPDTPRAPINESDAVRSAVPGPIGQPGVNLERPSVMAEDRNDSKMADPPVRPFNQLQEEEYGQPKGNLSGLTAKDVVHNLPEDKHASLSTGNYASGNHSPTGKNLHGQEESPGQERNKTGFPTAIEGIGGSKGKNTIGQEQNLGGQTGRIGMDTGTEEDPHGPNVQNVPSHIQAKATDPNGVEEAAGITPILPSFNKMGISDNPEQKPKAGENLDTGSHDQFSPEQMGISDNPERKPKAGENLYTGSHEQYFPEPMGISDNPEQKHKAGENLYTGSHDQFSPEPLRSEYPDSVPKSFDPNNPEDNPKDLPRDTLSASSQTSTYTGKLTSAASSIVDTAKSAKNVVASNLGYSGNKSTGAPRQEVQGQGGTTKPAPATDYAHKIAATVTETLAPMYGKAAGAGSTIMSKVLGSATGTDNEWQDSQGVSGKEHLAEKLKPGEEDKALSDMNTDSFKHKAEIEQKSKAGEEVSTEGGRGVSGSFKHKAEIEQKSKAGEEVSTEGGRGVSEETEQKTEAGEEVSTEGGRGVSEETEQKTEAGEEVSTEGGRGVSEVISDPFNKREQEGSGDRKPMGEVAESEEVAKQLGTGGEEEGGGTGMVYRVKGVIGSWLGGKGSETQTTPGTTYAGVDDHGQKAASE